jgi:chromosome segregation ATPase
MKVQVLSFDDNLKEVEEDTEQEILVLRHNFEQRLKEERDNVKFIKQENANMRKKFETLTKEISDNKAELGKMFNEEKRLHSIIKSLEKDILGVKREVTFQGA